MNLNLKIAFVLSFFTSGAVLADSQDSETAKRDELKSMLDGEPFPEAGKGYKLFNVQSGSPFEKLGLKPGDKIISINGKDLNSIAAVQNAYSKIQTSESLEVVFYRDGKQQKKIVPAAR